MKVMVQARLRSAGWLIALAAVAFLPRAALALRRDTICSDAVFFVERGQALAEGDVTAALADIGLNLYTLLLAGAAAVNVDPALFGRWLSVFASALTVVPIAWLAGQWFGRRAGMVAGLLYAFAPEALDWSPEAIRDPLFWLMFSAGLAVAWRASVTQSTRDFLLWGLVFAAAILLRSEGALLIVPLAVWCGPQLWRGPAKTILNGLAAVACWPAALVIINAIFLAAGHDRLELGRLDHLRMLLPVTPRAAATAPTHAATPLAVEGSNPVSPRELAWAVRHNVLRGIGWPCLGLALIGALTLDRRAWHALAPLGLMGVGLAVAMAVYFLRVHELTARYAVPLLLILLPLAGRGADRLWAIGQRVVASRPYLRRAAGLLGVAALVLVCAQGGIEGLGRGNDSRTLKKALGEHLARRFGAGQTVLATENLERLVGYYAQARHVPFPRSVGGRDALDWLRIKRPELVVLWTAEQPERYQELLTGPCCLGYMREELPASFAGAALLVRHDVLSHQASASTACQTAPCSYTSMASAAERSGSAHGTTLTR